MNHRLRNTGKINQGRWVLVYAFVVSVISVLFVRAFDLQVRAGNELWEKSEANRLFTLRVVANRGLIVDRFGQPLAINKPIYYLIEQSGKLYAQRQIIPPADAMNYLATDSARIVSDFYRQYPLAEKAAHVIGYVGPLTEQELTNNPDVSIHSQSGKIGTEAEFNKLLAGQDGQATFEVNSLGQITREINKNPPIDGESVQLTLDSQLQQVVYQSLGDHKAAALVTDAQTGHVLALASRPSFNPNRFTWPVFDESERASRSGEIAEYFYDPEQRFFNRTLAGGYPPGSVFKLVTAMSALETGEVDQDTVVNDEGVLKVGDFEYGNWYYRQYGRTEGSIGITRAIARSNDIFFYKAAEWVGPDRLSDMSKLFGFGEVTGIGISGESAGVVPNPAWKEKVIGERWYLGNTYHFGIGQGDILVTPVQISQMMSVFANNGKLCRPNLLSDQPVRCQDLGLQEEHIETVRQGMIAACSAGGTAYPFFEWNSTRSEKVACKTGTAEFGGANEQGHRPTHGWFAMEVEMNGRGEETELTVTNQAAETAEASAEAQVNSEVSNYPRRIVIVVLIESDEEKVYREGSQDAAPIALEILEWLDENRY